MNTTTNARKKNELREPCPCTSLYECGYDQKGTLPSFSISVHTMECFFCRPTLNVIYYLNLWLLHSMGGYCFFWICLCNNLLHITYTCLQQHLSCPTFWQIRHFLSPQKFLLIVLHEAGLCNRLFRGHSFHP